MRRTFLGSILLAALSLFAVLGPSGSARAGGVFITGHDSVWHSNFGGNSVGARNLALTAIEFGRAGSPLPFLFVESTTAAVPSGNAREAPFLTTRLGYAATDFVVADAAMLNSFVDFRAELDKYSAVVVASDHGGMLTAAELQFLNAHADDLIDYVNSGGGIVAFAESNARGLIGTTPRFGFLPFVVSSTDFTDPESGNIVTAFGASLGLVDADVNGNFSHNFFTAAGGMEPVDLRNGNTAEPLSLAFEGLVGACGAGVLEPQVAFNPLGTMHQLNALITDRQGQPVPDSEVLFEVTEGPNVGDSGSDLTDANGEAVFEYLGDGGVGLDRIIAVCPEGAESNPALKFWDEDCQPNGVPDTCDIDCAAFDGECGLRFPACGASGDLDGNGVPDECNMASETSVDIKPTSCPNPFRFGVEGVLPAAILGSDTLDVAEIDPTTVELSGPGGTAAPLRWSIEDVAAPDEFPEPELRNDCGTDGPDGFDDLTVKFDPAEVEEVLGPVSEGDVVIVTISAGTTEGASIFGVDIVWIVGTPPAEFEDSAEVSEATTITPLRYCSAAPMHHSSAPLWLLLGLAALAGRRLRAS